MSLMDKLKAIWSAILFAVACIYVGRAIYDGYSFLSVAIAFFGASAVAATCLTIGKTIGDGIASVLSSRFVWYTFGAGLFFGFFHNLAIAANPCRVSAQWELMQQMLELQGLQAQHNLSPDEISLAKKGVFFCALASNSDITNAIAKSLEPGMNTPQFALINQARQYTTEAERQGACFDTYRKLRSSKPDLFKVSEFKYACLR